MKPIHILENKNVASSYVFKNIKNLNKKNMIGVNN